MNDPGATQDGPRREALQEVASGRGSCWVVTPAKYTAQPVTLLPSCPRVSVPQHTAEGRFSTAVTRENRTRGVGTRAWHLMTSHLTVTTASLFPAAGQTLSGPRVGAQPSFSRPRLKHNAESPCLSPGSLPVGDTELTEPKGCVD